MAFTIFSSAIQTFSSHGAMSLCQRCALQAGYSINLYSRLYYNFIWNIQLFSAIFQKKHSYSFIANIRLLGSQISNSLQPLNPQSSLTNVDFHKPVQASSHYSHLHIQPKFNHTFSNKKLYTVFLNKQQIIISYSQLIQHVG